jgi:glycerophosphoryl diester phosphodiesterase
MIQLQLPGRTKPYVMAHRGNRVRCPENTLTAFNQAIEDGADILETDLHLTADGEIVCIHDGTVDRTTDGSGQVSSMTLDELRRLDAAATMPDMPPEPVPTLIELIEIIPSGVGLALELKDDSFLLAERAHQLTELLESMAIKSRSVVLSFNREHLEAIRKADASIPLGWITLSTPYPVTGVQMIGPFWPLLFLNPFFVGWAHRRNQVVCPLDPVPEPRLWYYRLLHCDAVLSDDPGTTCRALGRTRNATP